MDFSNEPLDLHKNDGNFKMTVSKWEIALKLRFYVVLMPQDQKRLSEGYYEAYRATYRKSKESDIVLD